MTTTDLEDGADRRRAPVRRRTAFPIVDLGRRGTGDDAAEYDLAAVPDGTDRSAGSAADGGILRPGASCPSGQSATPRSGCSSSTRDELDDGLARRWPRPLELSRQFQQAKRPRVVGGIAGTARGTLGAHWGLLECSNTSRPTPRRRQLRSSAALATPPDRPRRGPRLSTKRDLRRGLLGRRRTILETLLRQRRRRREQSVPRRPAPHGRCSRLLVAGAGREPLQAQVRVPSAPGRAFPGSSGISSARPVDLAKRRPEVNRPTFAQRGGERRYRAAPSRCGPMNRADHPGAGCAGVETRSPRLASPRDYSSSYNWNAPKYPTTLVIQIGANAATRAIEDRPPGEPEGRGPAATRGILVGHRAVDKGLVKSEPDFTGSKPEASWVPRSSNTDPVRVAVGPRAAGQ